MPTCPLEKMYCGLPSVGGYGSETEYVIGAGLMAEAVHCLLGSIGSCHAKSDFRIELEHISEELGIIRYVSEEYSRSVYSGRTFDNAKEQYKKGTIKHLKHTSEKLYKRAFNLQQDMDNCEVNDAVQEHCVKIANAGFEVIMALAVAMRQSAEDYERTGKLSNQFKNKYLVEDIATLTRRVKAGLKVQGYKLYPYKRWVGEYEQTFQNPAEGKTEKGNVSIDTVPGYQKGRRGRARRYQEGHSRFFRDRTIRNIAYLEGGFLDKFRVGMTKINNVWLVVWQLPLGRSSDLTWSPVPWSYIDTENKKLTEYAYGWDVDVGHESRAVSTVKKGKKKRRRR